MRSSRLVASSSTTRILSMNPLWGTPPTSQTASHVGLVSRCTVGVRKVSGSSSRPRGRAGTSRVASM